jgi:hypothetical protein
VFSGGRVGVLVELGASLASFGGRKRTRERRSIPTSSRLAARLPRCPGCPAALLRRRRHSSGRRGRCVIKWIQHRGGRALHAAFRVPSLASAELLDLSSCSLAALGRKPAEASPCSLEAAWASSSNWEPLWPAPSAAGREYGGAEAPPHRPLPHYCPAVPLSRCLASAATALFRPPRALRHKWIQHRGGRALHAAFRVPSLASAYLPGLSSSALTTLGRKTRCSGGGPRGRRSS